MIAAKKGKPLGHSLAQAVRARRADARRIPARDRADAPVIPSTPAAGLAVRRRAIRSTAAKRTGPRTMLHAIDLVVPREGKPAIVAHAPLPVDFLALGAKDGGATDG